MTSQVPEHKIFECENLKKDVTCLQICHSDSISSAAWVSESTVQDLHPIIDVCCLQKGFGGA